MKGWLIFNSVLGSIGLFLMISFIIEGDIFYTLLNAFTFIANLIMFVFNLKKDAPKQKEESQ